MTANSKSLVSLVTGSAQGLGLDIARAIAKRSSHLAIHGLMSQCDGDQLANALASEFDIECIFFAHDLSTPSNAASLVSDTIKRFGTIDVLVNNAGMQHPKPFLEFEGKAFEKVINVNLVSLFYASQVAARVMVAKGFGRIVNIASVHGQVASTNKCAYVASKHGVIGLTKATALEVANTGVTVNAVCPGWVDTEIFRNQTKLLADAEGIDTEEAKVKIVAQKQPISQTTPSASIGAIVEFMIGENSDTLTGAAWNIDGGWLAH